MPPNRDVTAGLIAAAVVCPLAFWAIVLWIAHPLLGLGWGLLCTGALGLDLHLHLQSRPAGPPLDVDEGRGG